MPSELTPADAAQVAQVDAALERLRAAAALLKAAGALKAHSRTKDAIKSAEGARRHIDRRFRTTEERGASAAPPGEA